VPLLLAALALLSLACSSVKGEPESAVASGIILNLTQRTFTELETIEIRTESGELMTFQIEGDTGLTPGHAREHMSFVEPVTVHYRVTDRGRAAFLITDATSGTDQSN
jgi:hypothetical protein